MPIEMPKGLPFSVDTWTPSSKWKRHHFLTHAHKDHSTAISSYFSYPIYTTHLTENLLLQQFPQLDDSLFLDIEVGQSIVVNDPDGPFSVTAFDANHCPGAVMFLFEGDFGNILHTGDCRLTPECLQSLPMKYLSKRGRENISSLDYLFLDCTFGRCPLKMPSKSSAIQQVINCIWKHPDASIVYLTCDLLGQEEILVEISKTFGSKIYVDKNNNAECFQTLMLTAPHILTDDISSRFHVFQGFPRLYERAEARFAEARANFQPEPLFIRASAQWYACEEQGETQGETQKRSKLRFREAERDQFGVWHVCYSMHSSREELEWALDLLQPKRVISTTPSCRAMELDYVRTHCFSAQVTADDPLWKLMDINTQQCSLSQTCTISENAVAKSMVAAPMVSSELNHLELKNLSVDNIELCLNLSPPSSKRPITLFGRARLGFQNSNQLQDEKKNVTIGTDLSQAGTNKTNKTEWQLSSFQEASVSEVQIGKSEEICCREELSLQDSNIIHEEKKATSINTDQFWSVTNKTAEQLSSLKEDIVAGVEFEKTNDKGIGVEKKSFIGSSRSLGASLKKLYRSMNVPVPRPLPSLVELMGANKRVKFGSHNRYNSSHSYNPT
ncbi:DNA repair metallo-beta-lactamase family protein [Tasmannia lanceolata]|uniref:DNA repair metallo-beta-lactamase family protein n=1 Tax=Tasmannia lanceolata TaxID=3420 RepID=UPI004062805C